VPYFRNRPLLTSDAAITTAVVVIHGANMRADFSYENLSEVATSAGALEDTLIVAPYFQAPPGVDCDGASASPSPGDLVWSCDAWKDGASALNGSLTSYDVVDQIVEAIAAPGRFPNLSRLVVAGHSAGGQFTVRYAAFTHTPSAGRLRYVVANPSSYPYLDGTRAAEGTVCSSDGCAGGFTNPYFDASSCPSYDQFPYGLEAPYGYAADAMTNPAFDLVSRNVAFMVGDLDVLANAGGTDMDTSCSANAQGIDRRSRALGYWNYLRTFYGKTAPLSVVPGCMHSESCMFSSADGVEAIFGR
jgi:hypothetical protein